jgi:hypothetical protein
MRFLLTTVVVLAAAAGVAAHAAVNGAAPNPGRLELIASVTHAVVLKGVAITGLYPGAVKPLTVTVTNKGNPTIKVATVKTRLSANSSRVGCSATATNLVVRYAGKPVTVPKNASRKMTLTVTMPSTAVDGCQGAKFTIALSVRATKV